MQRFKLGNINSNRNDVNSVTVSEETTAPQQRARKGRLLDEQHFTSFNEKSGPLLQVALD